MKRMEAIKETIMDELYVPKITVMVDKRLKDNGKILSINQTRKHVKVVINNLFENIKDPGNGY